METTRQSINELEQYIFHLVSEDKIDSTEYHFMLTRIEYLKDKFLNGDTEKRTNKSVCDCLIPSPAFNCTDCLKCDAPIPETDL